MNKPSILISPHNMLIPVAKLLSKYANIWGATPDWTKTLAHLELPVRALGETLTPDMQDQAWNYAGRMIAQGQQPIAQNGLGDKAYNFISERAAAFLGPRVFDVCALVLALDKAKPDLVLIHNDVEPRNRAIALWAKSRNVPSLHVPHAIYQDIRRGPIGTDIHDIITASHLASAGEFQSNWYKKRGFPAENIRETGSPRHDALIIPDDKGVARRRLRVSQEAPVICYAATWPQHTNPQGLSDEWCWSYRAFLELGLRNPDWELIVKCHPNGGEQNWQWHYNEGKKMGLGERCTVTPEHLQTCLWASDALVAYGGSNVIIDGAFVPHLRLLSTHGYIGEDAVGLAPMEPEGLEDTIKLSLSQPVPDSTGLRYRFAGESDGGAAIRVAEFAMELTNGND